MDSLIQIGIQAAIEASVAINTIRKKGFDVNYKFDHSPVTLADIRSSDAIVARLEKTGIPLIGEEIEILTSEKRSKWDKVWVFDPLDGTREFAKDSDEFCVCIAFIENNSSVFGIIANPTTGEILFGGKSTGTFAAQMDFQNTRISNQKKLAELKIKEYPESIIMSRFEKSAKLSQFTNDLKNTCRDLKVIKMGSALKFHELAKGNADIYPRFAPTMEWDIAAGQAILEGVGGSVCHLENNLPLVYNKPNLYNPYFIAKGKMNK